MAEKEQFNEILEEMLGLAGVPLNEQEDEEKENVPGDQEAPAANDAADDEEGSEEEGPEEPDEELQDEWEKTISTAGKFKIQWTDNYVYVWYRNKRSQKIAIPPKLKPQRARVSNLLNKILSHVEEVS